MKIKNEMLIRELKIYCNKNGFWVKVKIKYYN